MVYDRRVTNDNAMNKMKHGDKHDDQDDDDLDDDGDDDDEDDDDAHSEEEIGPAGVEIDRQLDERARVSWEINLFANCNQSN